MIRSLAQELLAERLLAKDDHVVVGVSGGPDSMALLHLLIGLNKSQGWKLSIHVAHLNHRLRDNDAEKDAGFVQAAADSLSLPCSVDSKDIGDLSQQGPGGIEETGRRERYAFFERVCLQTGAKIVAVGHHADDNAETILHRMLRGTGLRGLAGIPPKRALSRNSEVVIVRPLLRHCKRELLTYLADEGIAFREDRTNESREPMRNRIRHLVIPQIEAEVNPQVREALTRLGEQAQWLEEFLRETVQRTFETLIISRTDQNLTLNAEALGRKSRIVQTEIIRLAYRSFGLGEQNLSFVILRSALEVLADTGSGKKVNLPGGMTAEKRYHHLIFSLPSDEARESIASEIAVHLPGETILPVRRLAIECRIEDVQPEDIPRLRRSGTSMQECVDLDAVHPPLVVRTRRPGDRFYPLGAPGTKKLSEFLIDAKVDPEERRRMAVLCDHLGPIWIIGQRIDDRVKLTARSKRVLHLRARPLES